MWYPDPQVAHSAEVVAGFRAEPSLQRKSLLTFEDRPDSLASHRFDDIEQLRRIDSVAGDGFPIDPDPEKRQPLGLLGLHVRRSGYFLEHAHHFVCLFFQKLEIVAIDVGCDVGAYARDELLDPELYARSF